MKIIVLFLFFFDHTYFSPFYNSNLMNSSNPFALVVLAARNAINAKNNEGSKLKFKIVLTRLLMQRGFTQDTG